MTCVKEVRASNAWASHSHWGYPRTGNSLVHKMCAEIPWNNYILITGIVSASVLVF